MKNIFSKPPSDELVLKAVRSLGFDSMTDTRWVEESALKPDLMEEVRDELRQIMYRCFVKRYVDRDDFIYKHYIVIVRQLIKTRGRTFQRKERCMQMGERVYKYATIYSLSISKPSGEIVVVFN
jgi:hypothetical protein